MELTRTPFEGLFILKPTVFQDSRGYFFESFSERALKTMGIEDDFVQDNQSNSARHVIRGLHFQVPPHAQTKLVRTLQGTILDVVVDLRKDQPTYGKAYTCELSAENHLQILVPKGFAHGFSVLSDTAEILYKCDEFYYPKFERGIFYDDPALAIDWKINPLLAIVSDKDKAWPLLGSDFEVF